MSQIIPCTNGSLIVESSSVEVKGPQSSAELDRGAFKAALEAAEAEYEGGLTSQVCSASTDSAAGEIQMTVHHNAGNPQAGDWAEVAVYNPASDPVHLQMGTFALSQLREEL